MHMEVDNMADEVADMVVDMKVDSVADKVVHMGEISHEDFIDVSLAIGYS